MATPAWAAFMHAHLCAKHSASLMVELTAGLHGDQFTATAYVAASCSLTKETGAARLQLCGAEVWRCCCMHICMCMLHCCAAVLTQLTLYSWTYVICDDDARWHPSFPGVDAARSSSRAACENPQSTPSDLTKQT